MSKDRLKASGYYAILPEWILYHPRLSPGAVLLFCVLQRHAGEKGIFPSRETLAEKRNSSVATIGRQLEELETHGILTRKQRCPGGVFSSNSYTLEMDEKRAGRKSRGSSLSHDRDSSVSHEVVAHP